mmetsp:Transcript_63805/g.78018  ORF Transcript_63805/g.78018 Transcript_63805/m.78018 type:complete len:255 (-) Transcript_63805:62-826(-)
MKGSKSLRGNKPETLLSLNFKEPNSSPILQRKHRKSPAKHRKASKVESLGLLQCAGVTIFEPITKSKSMILFKQDDNLGLPRLPDTHSLGDTHHALSLKNSINISQATPTIDTSTRQSPKRVSIYEHNNETVMFDNNFVTLDDYNPFDNKTDDLSDTERIILTPHDTNTHETDTNEDQSRLTVHIISTKSEQQHSRENNMSDPTMDMKRHSSCKHILTFLGENGFYAQNEMNDIKSLQHVLSNKMSCKQLKEIQ